MGSFLLACFLVELTAEKPATDTMALAFAVMLSRNGLDDDTDIVEMRRTLSANPAGVQPIPGLRLTIQNSDLQGGSAREIKLNFYRRIVQPIYREGPSGLAALADDPQLKQQILQGGGPLGILTLQTHRTFERVALGLALTSAVLLIPLVAFSSRFGRIGSPGVAILIASLPGSVIAALLSRPGAQGNIPSPTNPGDMISMGRYLVTQSIPTLGDIATGIYYPAFELGALLVLSAVVGNLGWRLWSRFHFRSDVAPQNISG